MNAGQRRSNREEHTEGRVRLDVYLVQQGLCESRAKAQALIASGKVRLNGQVVYKVAQRVPQNAQVTVEESMRFVSRGGEKLEAALRAFGIRVEGRVCADLGASTGGFTDCLLQWGARRVYAIDVGRELLHPRLRKDARVIVMEGINARYLEKLAEPISLVTIDASFISLRLLLPVVKGWLEQGGEVVALIKPQFEAGREVVARGQGVVREAEIHRQVLEEVLRFAQEEGFALRGLLGSPVASENREFLCWLQQGGGGKTIEECLQMVELLPKQEFIAQKPLRQRAG